MIKYQKNQQLKRRIKNGNRKTLGADSLDVLEIIMSIEDEFNIKIPTNGAENIVTVGDAFEAIKKVMNK